jgi:predicted RecB family nuclease
MSNNIFTFQKFLNNSYRQSELSETPQLSDSELLFNKRYNIYYKLENKYNYDLNHYDLINKFIEYVKVLLYLDEKESTLIEINNSQVLVENNLKDIEKYLGITVKRKRFEEIEVNSDWLSPNIIKAGMIGDNYTVIKKLKNKKNVNQILVDGIEFERKIINIIKEQNNKDFIQIGEASNISDITKFRSTIDYMAKGMPIIYQPILYDFDRCIYCCPDLIIRSDYINNIIKTHVDNGSCYFSNTWYYIVIDIKNKKLKLNVNLKTIRNDSIMMKMNKGQIYICNEILGKIQDYTPSNGYILGNGWQVNSTKINININDPFNKLGIIDFINYDSNIKNTINDVYQIIEKYKNSNLTDVLNNLPPELYPNMKNKYDFYDQKLEIALKVGELTLLPFVTNDHKLLAHSKGIYSWMDKNCSGNILGLKKQRAKLVDKFISANRDNIIHIKRIQEFNNEKLNLFVDFETVNDIIFMIGLVYTYDNKLYEKQFIIEELNKDEENRICEEFAIYLKNFSDFRIYHWGYFEKSMIKNKDKLNKLEWIDMKNIIKNNMIVFPKMFNYGLKNVVNSMHNIGIIKTIWDDKFKDGLQAMNEAKIYYKNKNLNILESIKYYNLVDCKVMKEIYDYLALV